MMNAHRCRLPACALLAAFVGGCAVGGMTDTRPVNLSGFSAAFKQGYADGCDSAGAAMRRNESRYKLDS